jgi:hypothetical protein
MSPTSESRSTDNPGSGSSGGGESTITRLKRIAAERLREPPGVNRVVFLRMEFVGPRQTFLVASADLDGDLPESSVAYRLRELEEELETESYVREAVLTLATPEEPSL